MQAVTLVSQSGDQAMFFSAKSSDMSFADILQNSNAPAERPADTKPAETQPVAQTTESTKASESTNPVTDKQVATDKKVEKGPATSKKEEEDKKLSAPIMPYVVLAPKEIVIDKAKTSSKAWTEIPPVTLRIGGKSIAFSDTQKAGNASSLNLANLAKDLKSMLALLNDLQKNSAGSQDQQVALANLLTKISKSIESLNTQNKPDVSTLKELIASLKTIKDAIDAKSNKVEATNNQINPSTALSKTEPTTIVDAKSASTDSSIASAPIQDNTSLLKNINSLLSELNGVVSDVRQTQTFKAELKKGIELSNVQSNAVATSTDNKSATKVETNTADTAPAQNASAETLQKLAGISVEKQKNQNSKASEDTIKPLFSDNLNQALDNKMPAAAPAEKTEVASTPLTQTASIEKQTAILSQFRTFLAVTKLRAETEVTLRLHPKELGEIKIQISRLENQATHEPATVSAKFQVSSEMVKAVLESNFNMLKDSLQQQGNFNMGQMSVDVQTGNAQGQGFQNMFDQNTGTQAAFLPEENNISNLQSIPSSAHLGDLDRVA